MGGNNSLSFKKLSQKIVTLLMILSGERINSISSFMIHQVHITEFDCTFIPSKLLKHSRPSFVYKPVRYRAYPHNLLLCPVATISGYVKRRESMNVQCDEFIITHGKPHKPAHSETMSRWLKEVMSESGVDVKIFKPHSCRSASTSAAIRGGIPVATILQQGNWSNVKTFSRYYNRDIPTEMDFTTVVIESKQN